MASPDSQAAAAFAQAEKLNAFRELGAATWQAVRGNRLRFLAFVIFFVFGFSLDLASPWAIGYVLSVLVEKGLNEASFRQAFWGVLMYVGLKFLSLFLHHLARYLQIQVAYSARLNVFYRIFGSYMTFPLPWHVHHHSGDSLSKLQRAAGAVEACVGNYIWQMLEGVVKIVFAGVALFALDLWVAVNVLTVSLFTLAFVLLFNRKLVDRIRRNNAFIDRLNRLCVDYFFNVVTVKTLGLQRRACDHIERQREEGLVYTRDVARLGEIKWASIGIGYSLLIGSSLIIYLHDITLTGRALDVAAVYVLLNYLDRIFQALGSFTGYYSGIVEAATAYEDASHIVEEAKPYADRAPPAPLAHGWKEIAVIDVAYSYARGDRRALHKVSLKLRPGEKIALVGPSGGGKTTLLRLLGGILLPESGVVFADGANVPFERLQASSLLIPQEPEIFAGTLHDNLVMGEEIPREAIDGAVEICRAGPILEKLPQGWKTDLAEKGLNLSVGEKQRIALARGLLRAGRRDILLLDEPTSSLDPVTEQELFNRMLSAFADRTIVTACHRLSLVPLFNRILHIRDGALIEEGTFQELRAARGSFALLWDEFQRNPTKAKGEVGHPRDEA